MNPTTARLFASFAALAILCGSVTTAVGEMPLTAASMDQAYSQPGTVGTLVSASYSADIEARLAALESAATADEEPEWTEVGNQKWTSKFGGRIMSDFTAFADQNAASVAAYGDQENMFEIRRMRFFMSGSGYGVYDYKLQLDFADSGVVMKDAFIGMKELPLLGRVKMGHFKEPFGLEELTSSKYISFIERTAATSVFTPSRNIGMASYHHNQEETATWAIGAFFNDVHEADKIQVDDNQGVDIAMRYTCLPIYGCEGRSLLHLGAGYAYSDVQGDSLRLRARPDTHGDRFLDTGTLAVSDFHRINAEMATVYGPFSVQSELFYGETNNLAIADQDHYGAYVQGSYFLTGEHRPYKKSAGVFDRVKPNTNFFMVNTCNGVQSGWGALEATVRFSYLDLAGPGITDAESGEYRSVATGLNWYWNPNTRMMFNYNHAMTDVIAAAGTETEILSARLQVDF